MKRRDFIKVSSAAGLVSMVGPGYGAMSKLATAGEAGFDLHPFIKEHPEAVFIHLTSIDSKSDTRGIYDVASTLAKEMFVKTSNGEGYSNSTKITCKPNWTCSGPVDNADPLANVGITTDINFIEGFLNSVKEKGPKEHYLRECACPQLWGDRGYTQMAERNNFNLRDLSTKHFWELEKDDVIFKQAYGWGFFANGTINTTLGGLSAAFWHGHLFYTPQGGPIFQSYTGTGTDWITNHVLIDLKYHYQ